MPRRWISIEVEEQLEEETGFYFMPVAFFMFSFHGFCNE